MRKRVFRNFCALALAAALMTGVCVLAAGTSVDAAIADLRATIESFEAYKADRRKSDECLETMVTQLSALEEAVNASGGAASEDAFRVLDEAESAVNGRYSTDASEKALKALSTVRSHFKGEEPEPEPTVVVVSPFLDLEPEHWAYKAAIACVARGAIQGTAAPVNGMLTFNPQGTVTLGEFLAVCTRLVAADKIPAYEPGEHWAAPYLEAARAVKLFGRFDHDVSELDNTLTRQEMAEILVNSASANGEDLDYHPKMRYMIADYGKISSWYQNAVEKCYTNGLLTGVDGQGTFNPYGTMTRAEMAVAVGRLMKYVPRQRTEIDMNEGATSHGGYVTEEKGVTQGMILSDYSREFELQALGACRAGEDEKGVYITFTAPVLPEELREDYTIWFSGHIARQDGVDDRGYPTWENFASPIHVGLKSGESKTLYFEGWEGKVTADQVDEMSIGVSIANPEGRSMFSRSISSISPKITSAKWHFGDYEFTDFDSSLVWEGIGK